MTTFDQKAWKLTKRATRARKHQQRIQQLHEAEPGPWLLAVDRDRDLDHCTDTAGREQPINERP